jgi:hypothetical protein
MKFNGIKRFVKFEIKADKYEYRLFVSFCFYGLIKQYINLCTFFIMKVFGRLSDLFSVTQQILEARQSK